MEKGKSDTSRDLCILTRIIGRQYVPIKFTEFRYFLLSLSLLPGVLRLRHFSRREERAEENARAMLVLSHFDSNNASWLSTRFLLVTITPPELGTKGHDTLTYS